MKVKIDFWSIASIILNGGIYMNALTDIKSKIEKNKEEKSSISKFYYIGNDKYNAGLCRRIFNI